MTDKGVAETVFRLCFRSITIFSSCPGLLLDHNLGNARAPFSRWKIFRLLFIWTKALPLRRYDVHIAGSWLNQWPRYETGEFRVYLLDEIRYIQHRFITGPLIVIG